MPSEQFSASQDRLYFLELSFQQERVKLDIGLNLILSFSFTVLFYPYNKLDFVHFNRVR